MQQSGSTRSFLLSPEKMVLFGPARIFSTTWSLKVHRMVVQHGSPLPTATTVPTILFGKIFGTPISREQHRQQPVILLCIVHMSLISWISFMPAMKLLFASGYSAIRSQVAGDGLSIT